MKKIFYEISNNFTLRIPSVSYSDYLKYIETKSFNFNENEEFFFREGILGASEEVFKYLDGKSLKEAENNKKYLNTLSKYYIRTSCRTTPFGLFSMVCKGRFSDEKKISFDKKNIKRFLRPDIEFIVKLTNKVENIIGEELYICWNNTNIEKGNKLDNLYKTYYSEKGSESYIIDFTKAVKLVKKRANKFIEMKKLVKWIVKEYNDSNINYNMVLNFILDLKEKEFLISNLRIELVNNKNILETFINRLIEYDNSKLKKIIEELKILNLEMNKYENSEKDNINILKSIIERMKEICDTSNSVKIDTFLGEDIILSNKFKKDFDDLIDLLMNYGDKDKFSFIESYKNKFISKFGERFVPFLTVIDSMAGIGLPSMDVGKKARLFKNNKLMNLLILDNSKEINLKNLKLDELENYNHKNYLYQESFQIATYIIRENYNNYKYLISPLIGSSKSNQIEGRFRYMYDDFNNNISQNSVELSYIPNKYKLGNVIQCYSDSKYILEYGTKGNNKKEISLGNISVCVKNNRFIFINNKTNEIINFTINNMGNKIFMPEILKLLYYMDNYGKRDMFSLFNDIDEITNNIYHIPRIVYGNIIISPEKWTMSPDVKDLKELKNFCLYLDKFWRENMIGENFWVGSGDNNLLLNIYNDVHKEILYKMIKRNKKMVIKENLFSEGKLLVEDLDNKKYISEFIFSFEKAIKNKIDITIYADEEEELINPLNEWIYFKLNIRSEYEDDFISKKIPEIVNVVKRDINKFFFIRYKDEFNHIRLRLNFKDKESINNSFILLLEKLNELVKDKWIYSFSINPYEREISRYGGIDLINIAEKVFYDDSVISSNILNLIEKNKSIKEKIIVISICIMLLNMGIDYEEQLEILDEIISQKEYRTEFNKNAKEYFELIDNSSEWENLRKYSYGDALLNIMSLGRENLYKYYMKIGEKEKECKLPYSKNSIILSVIHMHCNRIIGIDRVYERKVMAFLRHSLRALIGYKKYN